MKKRAIYVGLIISLLILTYFPVPHTAQDHDVVIFPFPIKQEFSSIYEGPHPDAIFLQLQSKSYKIEKPSQEYIYQTEDEVIVCMEDFLLDNSPGNPALPYQIYTIALPPEAVTNSVQIEIIHLNEREQKGEYKIAPAPPYLLDENETEEEIRWEFTKWGIGKKIVEGHNVLIYQKDTLYPAEYCQVKSGGQLRKWKVATIVYYPIRYNPVKSQLIVSEEIFLKISYDRDYSYLKEKKTKQLLRDDTFDNRAKKLFMNYDKAQEWYIKPFTEGLVGDPMDPNYAIITTENIYSNSNSLDDFCFHKQDLGFTVIVVTEHQTHTVDDTSGSYSFIEAAGGYEDVIGEDYPHQRPEKIRQWLMDNYLTLGIEYVLLIGNPDPDNVEPDDLVGDIPMQICWPDYLSDTPTDLFYSDLTGDWNLDDDDYVGEKYPVEGDSNLPVTVTENLYCVRWEGVVEVIDALFPIYIRIEGYIEGLTKIWFDKDNDGFNDVDIIIEDTTVHHPERHGDTIFDLENGHYPIKVEYTQSGGDAYCEFTVRNYVEGVTTTFKYDDGTGNYLSGLEADYFNDNEFSAPPDAERIDDRPLTRFIEGGDRGEKDGVGGVDFYPEVILGRIPFYGEDENNDGIPDYEILDGILTKIMDYENADIHEELWRRRALASLPNISDFNYDGIIDADYLGVETLMDNIAPPPLWEWYRIHMDDYPDVSPDADINNGCNIDDMVAAWNDPNDPDDGRGVVMWRTHGLQTSAQHVIHEDRLVDLDNTKPSIVIQSTCENGHPEVKTDFLGDHYPLGYTLLKQGAIATFSSSRTNYGGLFNPSNIDIANKGNQYLCYFLAKGVFYNINVGEVLAHFRECDAEIENEWCQIFKYNLFGDPSLSLFGSDAKSNNDIVFLLDGSGSMLNEGKWEAAVDGTVLYYELMKEFRHPAFKDRYNSVVFRWNEWAGVDASTTVPPSTGLKDITVPLSARALNAWTPIPTYWTPIGEGLQLSIEQFDLDSEESFYSNKAVLLLSDGKQNRGIEPLDVDIPEEVQVYTVGLGEDDIEPAPIEDIAVASEADFRITPSPREMVDFFIQILCDTSWKLQDVTVIDYTAPIDQNIAVFIAVWDDPTASISFDLDPPGGGPNITPTSGLTDYPPMEVTYHAPAADSTHAFYVCKNIPDELMGNWNFDNINDGGSAVPLSDVLLKVVEDPRTIAEFDIENIDCYTGQPIRFTATITENKKAKTGLTEVYADLIRSPAKALGTLMAENKPSSDYPSQPPANADLTLRSHYLLGVMEKMNIENFSMVGGPRIYLRDDGLGCDLKPDDGIYTGQFNDTTYEGSYTFKFRARGTNGDGVTFDRTGTLSAYVEFAACPTETKVEFISIVTDQQKNTAKATIKVTPRDSYGSYLGPFQGDYVRLWSSSGEFESTYKDHKDGSYFYTLVYPIDTEPVISVSVGDVIVAEQVPVKTVGNGPPSPPYWIILVFLLLLILILFIYRYIKARRGG